jgi:uncharacterized protein (DUF1778 family)
MIHVHEQVSPNRQRQVFDMATPAKKLKTEKIDIRISEEELSLIKHAAKFRRTTPTSFIREEALAAAESVIQDQRRFILTDAQWQTLEEAFSQPAKVLPNLKAIMADPEEWDEEE